MSNPLNSERLARERIFHDDWASTITVESIRVEDYFEACTAPENRFIVQQMGDLQGKYLLDLGCGAGENSVYFAKRGAVCVASDYSPGMVQVTLQLAERHGVGIEGCVADAMTLHFPDNSFDYVYASNLLHHLPNPEGAIAEMHRVLKPGGKACFWDPLRHNPVINIYRRMATAVRTPDEMPLHIDMVEFVRSQFSEIAYNTFWLATLWIFLQFYLIEGVDPNKERYWKKIIEECDRLEPEYQFLEKIDGWLKKLPLIERFAWNLAVVATK